MRQTKHCIAQFTFYDRTGIKAFLEKQAEKGWMLDKISSFAWKFRRIEPRKIHFAVTYFSKASVYDPEPTEHQRTFQEFCEHSGWKLASVNGPLQIFYNEAENPVPIETDPVMEVKTIHASARKNFLPSYFMLLVVALIQLFTQLGQLRNYRLTYLSQNTTLFNWLSFTVLLVMCLQEIGGYFRWYRKAKRAAEEQGEFVETKGHRNFQLTLAMLLFVALALLICSLERQFAVVMVACLAGMFALVLTVLDIKGLLKRLKASRGTNMAVTIGACVVLSFVVVGGLTYGMVKLLQADFWENEEAVETYEAYGITWKVYHDDIPLTVEDLLETDYEGYSYEAREQSSLLLSKYQADQSGRVGSQEPGLSYTVYTVKVPFLYESCLNSLLEEDYGSAEDIYGNVYYNQFRETDAVLWGADAAYQMYQGDYSWNKFLLCYGNSIVYLVTDWEMTPEQMAVVGDIFGE